MTSKSGSCRATLVVEPGSRSCKGVAASDFLAFRTDSKFDKFKAPKKGNPAPSHANTFASSHSNAPAPAKSILALTYSKTDLMKILKIFSKTKGQESKGEFARKQPLKAKVLDIYFGKLHMDCFYFSQ